MRHLETQTQKEELERKRARYIGIFLLLIMVVSTAGYALLSYASTSPEPQNPSSDVSGRSSFVVGGQTLSLTYPPEDLVNISMNFNSTLRDYQGIPIYVSSENQVLLYELSSTLGRFTSKMQKACYGSCTKNLPERNCSDPFIIIHESDELKVSQNNQCIFIQGDLRSVDAFLYRILKTP